MIFHRGCFEDHEKTNNALVKANTVPHQPMICSHHHYLCVNDFCHPSLLCFHAHTISRDTIKPFNVASFRISILASFRISILFHCLYLIHHHCPPAPLITCNVITLLLTWLIFCFSLYHCATAVYATVKLPFILLNQEGSRIHDCLFATFHSFLRCHMACAGLLRCCSLQLGMSSSIVE